MELRKSCCWIQVHIVLLSLGWTATLSNAGRIGTVTDETVQYELANDTAPLYLNTGSPATSNGHITSISYCYSVVKNRERRGYEASVGTYRLDSNNMYILVNRYRIVFEPDDIPDDPFHFQCESMSVPTTSIQAGDVIGICSTDLDEEQFGRLNFIAATSGAEERVENELAQLRPNSEPLETCTRDGRLPRQFRNNQLREDENIILLLYANIEPDTGTVTVTDSTTGTVDTNDNDNSLPTDRVTSTLGQPDDTSTLGQPDDNMSSSGNGNSVRVNATTESSVGDTEEQSNSPLSREATIGIAAGASGTLLICICTCFVLACCYSKRKRRRRLYYDTNHRDVIVNEATTDYHAFGERTSPLSVQPHIIGPEHLSSSATHIAESTTSHAYATVPAVSNRVFTTQNKGSKLLSKSPSQMDTTAVVYTELLQRENHEDEARFELPAEREEQIYAQLRTRGSTTLNRGDIECEEIGGGLRKTVWKHNGRLIDIHLRRGRASEDDKIRYLQEAAILAQFKHPNVIEYYGILVDGLQVTIVEELLCGSLKSFLIRLKSEVALSRMTPKILLNFSQQVALGLKYLSGKGFVHGKIMASSVMLSSSNVCKIIDFSWSSDIAHDLTRSLKVSIQWSAPEVVSDKLFTVASDVWSYGCLLYEIWSLGKDPFKVKNVAELIKIGRRSPPPPGCPKVIYELMMESWNPDPSERPSFAQLVRDLMRVEALVLNIPQKLLDKHPQCGELGGPRSNGSVMYKDIQTMYNRKDLERNSNS